MFALPLPIAVEAFAPSVLPDFYAIPAPIPNHPPSAPLPLRSLLHTRSAETSTDQEPWRLPGLFSVIVCCSVPSATPGRGLSLVLQKSNPGSAPAMPGRFSLFRRVSPSSSTSVFPLLPLLPLLPASIANASATPTTPFRG